MTDEILEKLIDIFEKETYAQKASEDELPFSQLFSSDFDDNNRECSVCGFPNYERDNQIIFCDGCDIAVHQYCYGVFDIPDGNSKSKIILTP